MKKVLFVATITKHILRFHLPFLKWFQEQGFETHVAAAGEEEIPYCDVKHPVPIARSPFSLRNVYANQVLKKIIDSNNFSIIHGHTPMGGVLARAASVSSRKNGTRVLYTAHGFHFFRGAPWINWLLYYPMEKLLSRHTDGIITINQEDYQVVFKKNFKSPGKHLIYGVGVNDERFKPVSREEKTNLRKVLGYSENQLILIYVAEFIPRKNHKFLIESTPALKKNIPDLKIILAGRGELLEKSKELSKKLGVVGVIDFLGFRNDVEKLMAIADIGISTSKQEGLGLNLAEEMLTGLPIVATQDRGHRELVINGYNGFLFEQNNKKEFIEKISLLAKENELRESFGQQSIELAQKFTLPNAIEAMAKIYKQYID